MPRAQSAARLVKETMDKKYNESWVVIIGEGFGFEVSRSRERAAPVPNLSSRLRSSSQVTHEVKHVLWMYFNNSAILVYKAGARQAGA